MEIRCIHQGRSALGESALWSPREKALYWLDQIRPEIHRLNLATGTDDKLSLDLPAQLGALVPYGDGGLALAAADGVTILSPDMTERRLLVNPIANLPNVSFNDAKCDRQGRLWAGTTDRLEAARIGCLYRIDADSTATIVADDFICSNGPSFSPDGRIMYHSCSHERTIHAYDVDLASGRLSNRRVFVVVDAIEGVPDGSTVDAEGYLWSTHWGGSCVTRYAPDGRVDRKIEMPVAKIKADRAKTPGIRGEAARRASGEGIGALGLIGRLTRPKRRPGPQCAPIEPPDPPQAATAAVMASTPRMLSARRKL